MQEVAISVALQSPSNFCISYEWNDECSLGTCSPFSSHRIERIWGLHAHILTSLPCRGWSCRSLLAGVVLLNIRKWYHQVFMCGIMQSLATPMVCRVLKERKKMQEDGQNSRVPADVNYPRIFLAKILCSPKLPFLLSVFFCLFLLFIYISPFLQTP